MKCPNCGFDNKDDSLFCEACGNKLIRPEGQNGGQNVQTDNDYNYDQYSDQDEEERLREERRRRAAKAAAKREAEKKQNQKMIIIGIVIAGVIAAAGVLAFVFFSNYFSNSNAAESSSSQTSEISSVSSSSDESSEEDDTVTVITPDVTATTTPTPTATATPTATPTPTEEAEEEITARLTTAAGVSTSGYSVVDIARATASSELDQQEVYGEASDIDNSAEMAVDGDETTSWQEGVNGDGIGEYLHFTLDEEYDIKYISFKMGNWRNAENYSSNNRPREITVRVGTESFDVTIPDSMTEYILTLSDDVQASEVYIYIDSVYEGQYDDTCISEVTIYGK